MNENLNKSKRLFIQKSIAATSGLVFFNRPQITQASEHEEKVSPAEDLMREHGVLSRVLLIYEESIKRLKNNEDLNPTVLHDSASIVRTFIENYHEKLEEDYLFPRFQKANRLVDLVNTLKKQRLFPVCIPILGMISCLFLAFWVEWQIWLIGLVLLFIGLTWQFIWHYLHQKKEV